MDSKGSTGVSKWKNKIKSFLTSPLPNHKSLSPEPPTISSNSKAGDIYVSDSNNYSSTGDDSYEARLSRLVGDLENVDYGASQQSQLQWDDSPVLGNLHPFAWAASPESQPPISINDALDAFPQSLNDYVTFADFGDIEVPSLDNTPTPASTVGPASSAVVSNASNASSSSTTSKSGASGSKSGTPTAKESKKKEKAQQNMLSPPGGPVISVPFNSPADNTDLTEASIATLSMPFSFEDLQNMGLVAGGMLDVGGGSPDDDFSKLLASTQAITSSSTTDDINADFSQYTFNLFPSSNAIPSPTSSGPSPALSYGESSTSNNSFEEALLNDPLALRKRGMSVNGNLQGLFVDLPQAVKTPTHSPQHSVTSSIPPTPSSFKSPSVPSSPYKRPAIHASALTWRVAPTALSPKSSIAVNSSKGMRPSSSQQSFLGQDPHTAMNRMNRINTASVPELKRRREEDQIPYASTSMHQRVHSNDSRPVYENPQQTRPIAGRRRVAAMQPSQSRKPVRSASHHQLYQQSQAQLHAAPPLPLSQTSWIDEDVIRNLYGQIDARTFMCRLQGCNSTSTSEQQMRQHVQNHYSSTSAQTSQQFQTPQAIWS